MDNTEALQLLEELDTIRVKAGLPRMDENSRRDFLKKMGAGAAAGVMGAAGMAAPKDTQAATNILQEMKHLQFVIDLDIENYTAWHEGLSRPESKEILKDNEKCMEALDGIVEAMATETLPNIKKEVDRIMGHLKEHTKVIAAMIKKAEVLNDLVNKRR